MKVMLLEYPDCCIGTYDKGIGTIWKIEKGLFGGVIEIATFGSLKRSLNRTAHGPNESYTMRSKSFSSWRSSVLLRRLSHIVRWSLYAFHPIICLFPSSAGLIKVSSMKPGLKGTWNFLCGILSPRLLCLSEDTTIATLVEKNQNNKMVNSSKNNLAHREPEIIGRLAIFVPFVVI